MFSTRGDVPRPRDTFVYYNWWVEEGMRGNTLQIPRWPHPTKNCPAPHVSRAQSESPSLRHGDLGVRLLTWGLASPEEVPKRTRLQGEPGDAGLPCTLVPSPVSEHLSTPLQVLLLLAWAGKCAISDLILHKTFLPNC